MHIYKSIYMHKHKKCVLSVYALLEVTQLHYVRISITGLGTE